MLVGITADGTAQVVRLFPPWIAPKPSQFPMGGPQAGSIMTNASIVSFDGKTLVVDLGGEKPTITVTPETRIAKPCRRRSPRSSRCAGHRCWHAEGDLLVAMTVTILTEPPVIRKLTSALPTP